MAQFCRSCGAALRDGQSFCGTCGTPASDAAGASATHRPVAASSVSTDGLPPAHGLLPGLVRWIAGLPIPISADWLKPVAEAVERKREIESRYPVRLHPLACVVVAILGTDVAGWILSAFVRPLLYGMFRFLLSDAAVGYLFTDLLNALALIVGARAAIAYWEAAQPFHPVAGSPVYAAQPATWTPEKVRRFELGVTVVLALIIASFVFGLTQRYIHGFFGAVLFSMFQRNGNNAGGLVGFVITAAVVAVCVRSLQPALEALVQES